LGHGCDCVRCSCARGLWGVAHAAPTRQVLSGFEPMSRDNSRVLLQEWSVESFTMWGIAALVVIATASASDAAVTAWVYRCSAGLLLALSILTSSPAHARP
jgi:hypothetical protein